MAAKPYGSLVPFGESSWSRGLPSPYYKASHEALRHELRTWLEDDLEMLENMFEWTEAGQIPPEVYQESAKRGIVAAMAAGAHIPTDDENPYWKDIRLPGGVSAKDWNGFHDLILIEALHAPDFGAVMGLFGGLVIGFPPIVQYGTKVLKDRVIPEILSGKKRVCLAITEPTFGSDVKRIACTATKTPDGKHYIVNGSKKWITNGIWSDYFTTAVRTSGKPGDTKGVSILLIPRTEGVITKKMKMGGQWAAGTTWVDFEDVKVPVENLIGQEGEGFKIIMTNFNHERLYICIGANSISRSVLKDAMAYAHKREVFQGKLIDQGVIRYKLGHMARVVEAQQAWIEQIVYQMDNMSKADGDRLLGGTTALAKANCGITMELVCREAVQILGGIGYTRGGQGDRIERAYREIKAITIPGGSEEIMLDLGVRQQIKIALGLGAKL
ncbi:putative acyl-CoA dehydrogenase [Cystobasidium minutum MCA 4210]|uniref:putative acyl-CoA dehydrogenase n=1 Tax=Cystobasidium minutum MCA 4210 TaxID=1397322 RepID=UPI0034CE7807|eukprot:jgi/Rhomi1/170913/fgenesh1_kg.4_\